MQFVAPAGTLAERLANISRFVDRGVVVLRNATLTTDANDPDAYLKLNLTVTGNLTLWNSSLEFPGWLNVQDSANVTFNNSTVTSNPDSARPLLSPAILGDTAFAPSIRVSNRAHLTMFQTRVESTYSDDTLANGIPGPLPLFDTGAFLLTGSQGRNVTAFQTDSSTVGLVQDWLYPDSLFSGMLVVTYNSTGGLQTTPTVDLNGSLFPLPALIGGPTTTWENLSTPLSESLIERINLLGTYQYLVDTGSFGTGPCTISVNLSSNPLGVAQIRSVSITLNPSLSYDISESGPSSTLLLVNSQLDIIWAPLPFSPVVQFPPYPWGSNKLIVSDGAKVLLANLSIAAPASGPNLTSAVLADSSSSVFTYRWGEFTAAGPGGPIPGAAVTTFPTDRGPNNATITSLNNLSRTSLTLWRYVQAWDTEHGLPGYGVTGAAGTVAGRAFLLLVASNLTNSQSVNASFLGSYHVAVDPRFGGAPVHWSFFNLTPYPGGLENASPDVAAPAYFSQYAAALTIDAVSLTVGGAPLDRGVQIGQTLGVDALVTNVGFTPVLNLSAGVRYVPPASGTPTNVSILPLTARTIDIGSSSYVNLTWTVNETTVGVHGTIAASINVTIDWNGGPPATDGGSCNATTPLEVLPSGIRIAALGSPPHNLSATATYISHGTVVFNGSGFATLMLMAVPVTGGASVVLATNLSLNGSFQLVYSDLGQLLEPGVPYLLRAVASYNGANSTAFELPGDFTIPTPTAPPQGFTIPWWVWLVVAIGAVAAVAAFLVRRRRPEPQMECGECGSLVPLGASTCPTCGIYFETESERCPRCHGEIPKDVVDCPNCHYRPADRPGPPGPEEDRRGFQEHIEQFRAAAQGELGEEYPEVEFWKWWRRQPSYQTFRDWRTGQDTPHLPTGFDTDSDSDDTSDGQ